VKLALSTNRILVLRLKKHATYASARFASFLTVMKQGRTPPLVGVDGANPTKPSLRRIPPMHQLYPTDAQDILMGLRELPSLSPGAACCGADALAELLYVECFLPHRPQAWEVEAALEALDVERGLS
jgi:hypothetical protein